ncbi:hypothetical protein EVAR_41312_1 [Eumeta japonica]|uniref:Uncharacterized protein n=1 Tax=Eumeta variegata TaxID=151549 RepID=A0A4C1X4X3_EUMVA|nr:hypothetical protein EVAR_41312_1 [Eumeta japonica]
MCARPRAGARRAGRGWGRAALVAARQGRAGARLSLPALLSHVTNFTEFSGGKCKSEGVIDREAAACGRRRRPARSLCLGPHAARGRPLLLTCMQQSQRYSQKSAVQTYPKIRTEALTLWTHASPIAQLPTATLSSSALQFPVKKRHATRSRSIINERTRPAVGPDVTTATTTAVLSSRRPRWGGVSPSIWNMKIARGCCVRPLSLFYSDASADGVDERSLIPRFRSHPRLRRNATMSHAFSCVQPVFIDL